MKFSPKISALLSVLILLVVVLVVYAATASKREVAIKEADKNITDTNALLPPTGKIDGTVNALNSEANYETETLKAGEDDATLITSDTKEINDFGQSYQTNDF